MRQSRLALALLVAGVVGMLIPTAAAARDDGKQRVRVKGVATALTTTAFTVTSRSGKATTFVRTGRSTIGGAEIGDTVIAYGHREKVRKKGGHARGARATTTRLVLDRILVTAKGTPPPPPPGEAPTVTITAKPVVSTTATTASVAFTTTGSPAAITCALDAGTALDCTSPAAFANLDVGQHSVVVRAMNAFGSGMASASWTITPPPPPPPPPAAPVVTISPVPIDSSATTAAIVFTATNSPTAVTCALDGSPSTACTSPQGYSGLALGSHTVVVTAANDGGTGSDSATWSVIAPPPPPDPPVVTISAPVGGSSTTATTASVLFGSTNGPSATACSLDGAPATACTSPKAYAGLGAGSHTVVVDATNAGGTGSASVTWTVTVPPPNAPVVTISAPANGSSTGATSAAVAWTATNSPSSTTCAIDAATAIACSSPKAYSGLAVGSHTVTVSAANAGGTGTVSVTWTVLPPAPVVAISSPTAGASSSATDWSIAWTASNVPTATTCSIDGGAATACTSPSTYTGLALGAHTVVVSATNAGGTGTTSVSFTVLPPPPPPPPVNSLPPAIVGTPKSGAGGSNLTVDLGGWTNSPTGYSYQWLRCSDAASMATCTNIAGATASTYHPVAADIEQYLRVAVTATNAGGSTQAVSAAAAKTQPS